MRTSLIITLLAASLLGASWKAFSSGGTGDRGFGLRFKASPGVAPVVDVRYQDECGSCHMAYSPGLLPARSWVRIMDGLADHFGDNAELDANTMTEITRYLVANSADTSPYRRSRQIMRSLSGREPPLRIMDVPLIRHDHDEIPDRMIGANPDVNSLSNCAACHPRADQGSFAERDIRIPGYGGWDD